MPYAQADVLARRRDGAASASRLGAAAEGANLVVREAIAEYGAREARPPDEERERRLAVIRELTSQPPTRPGDEVDRELRDLRRTRRTGWARPSD